MTLALDIGLFVLSMVLLWIGSALAVRGLTKMAEHFRVSEFVISFVIFGFASTFPELFVGITSALKGVPAVGAGTILGANLLDLTVIMGVIAIVGKNIKIVHKAIQLDIWYVLLASMPVLLIIDGVLSRVDGIILLIAFAMYVFNMWQKSKNSAGVFIRSKFEDVLKPASVFLLGIVVLFFASDLVVSSAESMALNLGVPDLFIALFLVAFSATLPEFGFAIKAVLEKHNELAIGDIFGNVIIDATFILGMIALISPITFVDSTALLAGAFTVFAALLSLYFIGADHKLSWKEGIILVFVYYVFLSAEFGINILNF